MKKTKTKEAFAAAIVQTLWIKGKITTQERDQMTEKTREILRRGNC